MEFEKKTNQLNNINTDFLIFISQEITTSLNGIVGAMNLIKNHEHSSTIKDLVETLDTAITRLEKFASKILLSNMLSSNKYNLKITDFRLKDLIQYSIIDLNDLVQQKSINVITENVPDNILVRADRDLVFRAIDYILHNAIKYSPQNSNVDIEVKTNSHNVICSFLDYGIGFSQEVLRGTFLPLNSINEHPDRKTTLSLFITKQIMDLLNGEINIYNKKDAGACVELIFNNYLSN